MLAPFMDDLDDNGKEPFEDINETFPEDLVSVDDIEKIVS